MQTPEFHPYTAPGVFGEVLRWSAVPSAHLGHPRDVLVWLPPFYHDEPERRYPVLYLHDGQNKMDAGTSFTGIDWDVDRAATELVLKGAMKPLIMVAVYNSPERIPEYNPLDRGPAYAEFLTGELMPVINKYFRTQGGRNNGLMGSSMGGLISLAMLWWKPMHFFGAACLSPSLWLLSRAGGPRAWLGRLEPPPNVCTKLYVDHGTKGAEGKGAHLAKELTHFALEVGLRKSNVRYHVARGGEHNEASWRERARGPLRFLFGARRVRRERETVCGE